MAAGDILLNQAINQNIATGQTTVFAMCGKNATDAKCISWKVKREPSRSDEQIKKLFKALKFGNKPNGIIKAAQKNTIRIGSIKAGNNPEIVVDSELPKSLTTVMIKGVLGSTGLPTVLVDPSFTGIKLEADAEEDDSAMASLKNVITQNDINDAFIGRFEKNLQLCFAALEAERDAFPAFKEKMTDLAEEIEDDSWDEDKLADYDYAVQLKPKLKLVEGLLTVSSLKFQKVIEDIQRHIQAYALADNDPDKLSEIVEIQNANDLALRTINSSEVTDSIAMASSRYREIDQFSFFYDLPQALRELKDLCKLRKRALST